MSIKQSIEKGFENLAGAIFKFRWLFMLLLVIVTIGAASQLSKLQIDMSDEGFLHPDDPILTSYLDFRSQFGRDDLIVLAIKGDSIFQQSFLKKLAKLHHTLEDKLSHVDDITSMVNARNTYGTKDGIVVEDLLEHWPANQKDLDALRKRVLGNPLYIDRLISPDGSFTTLLIQLDTYATAKMDESDLMAGFNDADDTADEEPSYLSEEEKAKVVMDVQKIVKSFQADNFQISIAGSPVIMATVKKSMRHDMMLFIRLALGMVALSLIVMFRRVSGVVLPIVVVVLTLISTLAMMAFFGVPIKLPTMILPSFILAVAVGDSVHILSLFFQRLNAGHDKKEAIIHTMGHSGLAVVMTSLTTAGGLLSFVTAEIAPVFDLGIFAAAGVIIALLYTLLFLPAMLAVFPIKVRRSRGGTEPELDHVDTMGRLMDWITDFSTGNAKTILVCSLLIIVIAGSGLFKLRFSHDVLAWLPDKMAVHQATKIIDQELHGSVTLELVLDTGRENGLYDPVILNKIEKFGTELEKNANLSVKIGKVMAVTDILKEIHAALHEDRPEYYAIPQEEKLIPQEFLLFENSGSDDLEDVIDSRFQLARITIKVPWQDAMNYVPFIQEIEARAHKIFGPDMVITTTGIMSLFGRIIHASMYSAASSYMIAAGVITLMMIFLVGSFRLGLVSMIPNFTPIIITMGIMGWFNISLNMFTMLIGSIAIGLAVDDTIHFVYHFRRYFSKLQDPVEAVRQTLQTSGRAMLTTTIVLSLGFFLFMFASMKNLFHFGLLIGMALILALAADFFLAPALFSLMAGNSAGKKELLSGRIDE